MSLATLSSRGARGDISVSFEFFPPKTQDMEASLWDAIARLAPWDERKRKQQELEKLRSSLFARAN